MDDRTQHRPRSRTRMAHRLGVSSLALFLAVTPVVTASAQTAAVAQTTPTAQATPMAPTTPMERRTGAATASNATVPPIVERLGQGERHLRGTLRDLQVRQSVRLLGVQGEVGIPFPSRSDEIVKSGTLVLDFAYSPSMLEDLSSLTVLVNDEVVRNLPLPKSGADGTRVEIPLDPALIVPGDNRLNLRLVGHYTRDCEDPLHSSLWANISNVRSYLDLRVQRLGIAPDLQSFPAPFFDAYDIAPLRLPFVFGAAPSNGDLEAAATMASALGAMASYRGFAFPAVFNALPEGDAIVFMTPDQMVPGIERTISGPSVAVVRHPSDPYSTLLLVMGRDAGELKQAAAAVAYSQGNLKGEYADLTGSSIPAYGPNSAPRWVNVNKVVQLGELAEATDLVGMGLQPGRLQANFRLPPDLFFWPSEGARLKSHYRYPRGEWLDAQRSRLDLTVNGQYVRSLPIKTRNLFGSIGSDKGITSAQATAITTLPAYTLFGQNELGFNYDLQITDPGECVGRLPNNVLTSIEPDSTLDFRSAHHAARMPNLALFTGGGFPFTRMPDLADTAVLMGENATAEEIEAFLHLMGQFGNSTGVPTTRLTVMRTVQPSRMADKDILVVGNTTLAQNNDLFEKSPVRMRERRLEVVHRTPLERFFGWFTPEGRADVGEASLAVSSASGFEGVASFASPFTKGRHVVAVLSSQPASLPQMASLLPSADAKAQIRGDLIMRNGNEFRAFQVKPTQWRGNLPWWLAIGYWFSQRPFMLALSALLAAMLVGFPMYYALKAHGRRRLTGKKDA